MSWSNDHAGVSTSLDVSYGFALQSDIPQENDSLSRNDGITAKIETCASGNRDMLGALGPTVHLDVTYISLYTKATPHY